MNEREIFEQAVEIRDRQQRDAFLNQVCRGDSPLHKRLDELLASHDQASGFLQVPVVDQFPPPALRGHHSTIELPSSSGTSKHEAGRAAQDDLDEDHDAPADATDLSFLQASTKPGSLGRLGHYEILQVLGQGAFGIVFKAFDEKLHRHVALKAMSPQLASLSPPRKRFLREARSVAAIKHENIVQVHAVEEQPLPYLVMEFVDGPTLQQKLDGAGPLDVPEILHLGRQMAAGLAAAHDKGLIHRDIKPGNILLEAGVEQKVKITDFGLARAADDATMTRTGTIAGTPMYMAPEQALGQDLDHRADLFSLGSVLYQMASGRAPFRGANAIAVLKRVVDEAPRPIRQIQGEVPEWLCAIIEKLQAKSPAERFQSALEVADLLARCQNELQLHGQVTCVAVPSQAARTSSNQATSTQATSVTTVPDVENASAKPMSRGPVLFAATAVVLIVGFTLFELTGISNHLRKPVSKDQSVASGDSKSPSPDSTEQATSVTGQPASPPRLAIEPFDGDAATKHQEILAKNSGVQIEFTNSIGMEFVKVPKGTAWLGGGNALQGVKQVEMPDDFYLSRYDVTQAEWEQVTGQTPSWFSRTGGGQNAVKDLPDADLKRFPVEQVSWDDALLFLERLNHQEPSTDWIYRLPTEEEWEYACRGGPVDRSQSAFDYYLEVPSNELRDGVANFGRGDSGRPCPVGSYKPNSLGLHDMHGNVHVWCLDRVPSPDASQSDSHRVLRGGSYWSAAAFCRATTRFLHEPSYKHNNVGLRVARVRVAPSEPKPTATQPAPASGKAD